MSEKRSGMGSREPVPLWGVGTAHGFEAVVIGGVYTMKRNAVILALMLAVAFATVAFAHTALFSCFDNGDGTISCEGGFSDGSSAANLPVKVQKPNGDVILSLKLDKFGEATFKRPKGEFTVTMDGGSGHTVVVHSKNIK